MQELQMALYELLCTMAAPNYSSTVNGVSPTSPTCGIDLLRLLNAAISPTGSVANKNAKRAYDTHKDSFTDKTNFMTWWPMLLILQATKFNLGIPTAPASTPSTTRVRPSSPTLVLTSVGDWK